MNPEVLVVGAGIGGLTAALSLHAAGLRPVVVDAAERLHPLGVGINLLPHAVRELTELGLADEIAAMGAPIRRFAHFDRFGGRIWSQPRGRPAGYRWPQFAVHRGELQMMLLRAVHDRLGAGAVRTGLAFEDLTESTDGVRVRLRERATGADLTVTAGVLAGADGIGSAVRRRFHPDEGPPLWSGVRMWRGVAEIPPFLGGLTQAVCGSNAQAKFVAYPIVPGPDERGLVRVNWVAEVRVHNDGRSRVADWNREGRLDDVLPHFAGWTFDWLDVPALLAASPEILEYPMVDRDPLPFWGRGRTTLLGDAAHPMYPIGSNGGSQAIIDARVLAHALARACDPVNGLAAYEAARRETTSAIVLACRDMPADRVLHTVAERAPAGFGRIEEVLSEAELTAITASYTRTSGTDSELLNNRPSWTVPPR